MIIVEYCRFGNLQSYVLKNRNYFINLVDEFGNMKIDTKTSGESDNDTVIQQETTNSVSCLQDSNGYLVPNNSINEANQSVLLTDACQSISTNDLISWSFQIARGMSYLSRKKVWSYYLFYERKIKVNFDPSSSGSPRRLGCSKYFVGGQRSRQSGRFRYGAQNVL